MKLLSDAKDYEHLAIKVDSSNAVYAVQAFTGALHIENLMHAVLLCA